MSLKAQIKADMKDALRSKDQQRLDAIRFLQAAIQRKEVDDRIELSDEQVLTVIEKLVKQSRDAAAQFIQGGRQELADKEQSSVDIWQAYLPVQLTEAEVKAAIQNAINETGAKSVKDMGRVMGVLKPKLQGRADMGQASARVKEALAAL